MGLFDRVFKKKEGKPVQAAGLINEPTAVFTAFNGDAYSNDIYRGAVDAIGESDRLKVFLVGKQDIVSKEKQYFCIIIL